MRYFHMNTSNHGNVTWIFIAEVAKYSSTYYTEVDENTFGCFFTAPRQGDEA